MFENLIGQDHIKRYFQRAFESAKLPQSILFSGPAGTGKTAAALELARTLTCYETERRPCGECPSCVKFRKLEHPDVHLFLPVPGNIKPEEVQEIRKRITADPYDKVSFEKNALIHIGIVKEQIRPRMKLKSYQEHGRVVILIGADRMTPEAANAMLKLLEEPPDDVTFILTTDFPDRVLPTIASRCQTLQMRNLSREDVAAALTEREKLPESDAGFYALISDGSYTKARSFLQEEFEREQQLCEKIFEAVTEKAPEFSVALAEELSAGGKQSSGGPNIRSVFELMILILKYTYEHGPDTKNVRMKYFGKSVAIVGKFEREIIENAILEVEKSIDLLNKNVYLFLILLVLLSQLRKVFRNG